MKRRKLPEKIEYADLDHEKRYITKEYIEMRIQKQKGLTPKELKSLTPELKQYYNELENIISKFKHE